MFPLAVMCPSTLKLPPANFKCCEPAECVKVMSPLLKFITPPLARNKSDHCNDVEPNAAPFDVTGKTAADELTPFDVSVPLALMFPLAVMCPVKLSPIVLENCATVLLYFTSIELLAL